MQIEEGAIVCGKVTGLTDFGAFVELEGGKTLQLTGDSDFLQYSRDRGKSEKGIARLLR